MKVNKKTKRIYRRTNKWCYFMSPSLFALQVCQSHCPNGSHVIAILNVILPTAHLLLYSYLCGDCDRYMTDIHHGLSVIALVSCWLESKNKDVATLSMQVLFLLLYNCLFFGLSMIDVEPFKKLSVYAYLASLFVSLVAIDLTKIPPKNEIVHWWSENSCTNVVHR